MEQTIDVKYSCAACGIHRIVVQVPARQAEGVIDWVEKTMAQAISDDHTQRSPHCPSRTMSEVMIPMTGAEKVGGPAVQ